MSDFWYNYKWWKIKWGYRVGWFACLFRGHIWYEYADPNHPLQQPYAYHKFCERCLTFSGDKTAPRP